MLDSDFKLQNPLALLAFFYVRIRKRDHRNQYHFFLVRDLMCPSQSSFCQIILSELFEGVELNTILF